jgi:hypothetical protein
MGGLGPSRDPKPTNRSVRYLGYTRDGRHDLVNGGFRPSWTFSGLAENGGNVLNRASLAARDIFPKRLYAVAACFLRRVAFGLGAGATSATTFGLRPSPIFTASSLRFAA